ncbi:hypothetical protein AJ80_01533 [Polytolypa hystricis UAMH7299]|uniref:Major facilitator superfamily (MFS) profile domain-containing protein n=1 Tax=Polytolypa hystricis (strain UAMH7299) TaxID=1447883 RepID=A0A2B7Z0K4_POLH7|nr:hypothetical protein AJ80_01533 [Polytolypa hystricis UAMH7299]
MTTLLNKPDNNHVEKISSTLDPDSVDTKGRDFTVDGADLPRGYFRSTSFLGSMLAIGVSFACGVGGFAFVAPILSHIDADIGPDPNLTWVALTYTLTTGVCLVLVGRVSDLFGRRWFMIGGNCLGTIGSIVCATAQNMPAMIAGETLIGLGASTQISFAFTMNEIVPFKYRLLANGYVYIWGTLASGLAPVISYAFVFKTNSGWRGVYYFLIAMNAFGLFCWVLFYHPPTFGMKHGKQSKMQFIKHFDYVGTFMLVLGLLLFLMGLSWGGQLHPWNSAHVISTIVVGGVLLVALGFYEAFVPLRQPLLPVQIFKNRGLMMGIMIWSLGSSIYYAFAIIWPTMLVTLYAAEHTDPMWPGYAALAMSGGISFGELVGSLTRKRIHNMIQATFLIGAALVAATASCTPDTPARAIVLMFLGSSFIGWLEILVSTFCSICVVDQRELGTAIGFAGSARSTISTICATVYTIILTNETTANIANDVGPAVTKAGLPTSSIASFTAALRSGDTTALNSVPGITPAIIVGGTSAYQEASAAAYRTVFLSTIAFSCIGIICSVFLPNIDHLLTNTVSTTLHSGKSDEQAVLSSPIRDEESKEAV